MGASVDLLARHAAARPDKLAVVDDRPGGDVHAYTFAQLDGWAGRIAAALRDLAVAPTTKVAWCGQNSAGLLAAIGAIRKVGAVAVPVSYYLTAAEAAYILDNSDAEVACVDAGHAALIDQAWPDTPKLRAVVTLRGDGVDIRVAAGRVAPVPPDGLCGGDIFYTSGTTGRPKGAVRDPHPDPAKAPLTAAIGFQPDDVYLTTGPLYHSGPARFATIALALGNTIVVQPRFDAEDWLRLVDTYRVTSTFSAPTTIRAVCALPAGTKARYDRSSMRRFVGNAAPWTMALKRSYLADFPADSLWEVYGAAELGVATILAPADQLRKPGSCGLPAPGVHIVLRDDAGREVTESGVRGEVFVRSPSMFRAYYKAQEQYEADRRGDYHTVGDIAYRDGEGYLYIADRKKDVIISGGMNVYPAEVEATLDQSPDIDEVAVIGVPDERWGEAVRAVVVPSHPGVTAGDIDAYARAHLASYKRPRGVVFVTELPKTGSGKVLKRTLREWFAGGGPPC
jgi:fatty-acyl-CoA synthase/long-chain acyl-CoA synthetase